MKKSVVVVAVVVAVVVFPCKYCIGGYGLRTLGDDIAVVAVFAVWNSNNNNNHNNNSNNNNDDDNDDNQQQQQQQQQQHCGWKQKHLKENATLKKQKLCFLPLSTGFSINQRRSDRFVGRLATTSSPIIQKMIVGTALSQAFLSTSSSGCFPCC